MKRIVVLTTLLLLASAGCEKPTGPQTTEIDTPAPSRPVSQLMPVESTDTTGYVTDTTESEIVETPVPEPARTYVVCKGDTLWSISTKIYGDGQRWKEIAAANDITNESKLPIGKVLRIP